MSDVPSLPQSDFALCFYDEGGIQELVAVGYTEEQMLAYGEACARQAVTSIISPSKESDLEWVQQNVAGNPILLQAMLNRVKAASAAPVEVAPQGEPAAISNGDPECARILHANLASLYVCDEPAAPGSQPLTDAEIDAAILAEAKRLGAMPEMCEFVEYDPAIGRVREHWVPSIHSRAVARAVLALRSSLTD